MHPSEGAADASPADAAPAEQGFDVGRHSAPLLRRLGEELGQVIAERVDLGPGSEQTARIWGHGIVGMMHAAGDWWLGDRPCSARSWCGRWPICCGPPRGGGRPPGRPGVLTGPDALRGFRPGPPGFRPGRPARVPARTAFRTARHRPEPRSEQPGP